MKYTYVYIFITYFSSALYGLNANADIKFDNKYLDTDPSLYYLPNCSELGSELKEISLPKNHLDKSSALFNYYYKYVDNGAQETIVFLPGGPGGASMAWTHNGPEHFNNYNMIYIDPRGVGCNFFKEGDFPIESITTEQTALDIAKLIKKEKLNSYHIYGESYGTYLGIVLTSILNNKFSNLTQPKNLILEGTLGAALPGPGAFLQEGASIGNLLLNRYPELKEMFSNDDVLPLSYSSDFWAYFLARLTSSSLNYVDDYTRWDKLLLLKEAHMTSSQLDIEVKEYFASEYSNFDNSSEAKFFVNDPNEFVETVISCQEIETSTFFFYRYILENGRLSVVEDPSSRGTDPCLAFDFNGFDLDKFPITKTPTVYIHGELDPATPLDGAKKHFSKLSVKKKFIEVSGSAHSPLEEDLKKCSVALFKTITDGTWNFDSILLDNGWCKQ